MEQQRQLVTLADAQRLSGLKRRNFFLRLRAHDVTPFVDPVDRRKRWLLRADVEKIAEPVQRREPSRA